MMEWSTSQNELRPHFAKGVEAVFRFRFYQLQRFFLNRGSQYLQRWIGRLQVLRKRIIDAWMDTFQADPPENQEFQVALQAEKRPTTGRWPCLAATSYASRCSTCTNYPVLLLNKGCWKDGTTKSDENTMNLFSVERPSVHLNDNCAGWSHWATTRNIDITPCYPRNTVAKTIRWTLSGQRFWHCFVLRDRHLTSPLFAHPTSKEPSRVQYYVELESSTGYSATEEDTGQKGFVQECADIF